MNLDNEPVLEHVTNQSSEEEEYIELSSSEEEL